jgi:hypothetical protein
MTLVIPPQRRPYLYSDGGNDNYITYPLSMQIRAHELPILDGTKAHRSKYGHSTLHQQMERPKDQLPLHLCAIGEVVHTR